MQLWPWLWKGESRSITAEEALAALKKCEELRAPNEFGWNGFLRAMSLWKLEQRDEARDSYDRAAQWMAKYPPRNSQLNVFHVEAAQLLGLPAPPPPSWMPPATQSALDNPQGNKDSK